MNGYCYNKRLLSCPNNFFVLLLLFQFAECSETSVWCIQTKQGVLPVFPTSACDYSWSVWWKAELAVIS